MKKNKSTLHLYALVALALIGGGTPASAMDQWDAGAQHAGITHFCVCGSALEARDPRAQCSRCNAIVHDECYNPADRICVICENAESNRQESALRRCDRCARVVIPGDHAVCNCGQLGHAACFKRGGAAPLCDTCYAMQIF